mmetsp:Transcript_31669/g.63720  ORF Transcript_31669/g.63720 Transcript_31669/m.63720 type:complete len:102 (+) Transcript_31669:369-674(+)
MKGASNLHMDAEIRFVVFSNSRAVAKRGFLPKALGALVAKYIFSFTLKLNSGILPFDGAIGITLKELTVPGAPEMNSNKSTTIFGGTFIILHMGQTKMTPA